MDFITCVQTRAAVVVTINRPPVNAVNSQMYGEIRDTFNSLRTSFPTARVAILAAEGKHFCAGNDLGEFETMTPENAPGRMQGVREAFWAIRDCPLPVIAAVHGSALGTGIGLAASSDLIVCAPDSQFGLPELSVGVMGGGRHLARLLPQQLVRKMFFTADPISGAELARWGGAVAVASTDDLLDTALALGEQISRHGAEAIRISKRALNQIEWMELKAGYELEQGFTGDLSGTPDAKEALLAIRERRAPLYAGREE